MIEIAKKPVYRFFKRCFDIIASFLGLVILFVPFLVLSIIIVIDSPGASPIYVQDRVGKDGRIFRFYKFRSMVPDADKKLDELLDRNEMQGPAFKIKHDPRVTRVGRFIRKTSIDELPQLLNIIAGQMSIIGPRPALANQTELLEMREKNGSAALRPGLTGWAQINGRDELPDEIKAGYDGEYAEKISFGFDLKCFFGTIGAVLRSDGVGAGAQHKDEEAE